MHIYMLVGCQKLPDFRNQLPPLPQLALDAAFLYMLVLDLKGPTRRFGVDGLNLSGDGNCKLHVP